MEEFNTVANVLRQKKDKFCSLGLRKEIRRELEALCKGNLKIKFLVQILLKSMEIKKFRFLCFFRLFDVKMKGKNIEIKDCLSLQDVVRECVDYSRIVFCNRDEAYLTVLKALKIYFESNCRLFVTCSTEYSVERSTVLRVRKEFCKVKIGKYANLTCIKLDSVSI